ncbi:MAG: hypothetical protein GW855_08345 [Erythrobacter sp.]|nr:hypothetical protein [Erythrobacter sp.]NCQ64449.1 hypothetical protein [Alphaproteobacteria bacterium]
MTWTTKILCAGLLLSACHTMGDASLAAADDAEKAPADEASRTVDALAAASQARAAGDGERLRNALLTLAALGAEPGDAPSETLLNQWRASTPGDLPPLRGRTLGPAFRTGELSAGKEVRLQQVFLAGQSAVVALRTHSGGEVTMKVVDGEARTMCDSSGDRMHCRWTPPFTQRHEIRIANPMRGKVRYFISFS